MSIQSGDGVLEILDGTLKVSRLDIQDITGLDVGINTIARNMVLLRDDQTAATVPGGGVSASSGISRDIGNEETVFTGGYVYWPIKVPNAWTMHFKVLGALIFSFSNTSEPTSSVASDNHGGYKLVFDSANSRFSFYYQGTEIEATRTTYDPNTLTRVLINYEYGGISVVLDDDLAMNYALTHGEDAYTGEYVGFAGTGGAKVKDIKLTNGDKWQYTADSNASSIAYLNGNVGIGTSSPQKTLDVRGDARVTGNLFVAGSTFVVDQQNLSVKDKIIELGGENADASSNVGMIMTTGGSSNVAIGYRGEESELMIGFTSNIATDNELTPKDATNLSVKVYGDLDVSRALSGSTVRGDGYLLSNVTLAQVADYGNTTSNTIQFNGATTSLITAGNVAVGTTTALVDLAIGDANTGLNQEGEDELGIYTGGQERLRVDASGNVGVGTASPVQSLHVVGKQYINGLPQGASVTDDGANLLVTGQTTSTSPESLITMTRPADSGTNVASKAALKLSRWSADSPTASRSKLDFALSSGAYNNEVTPLTLQANNKVGIGNTEPTHDLDVGSNLYVEDTGTSVLTVLGNAVVSNKLTVQSFRISSSSSSGLQAATTGVGANTTSNPIVITNADNSTSTTTGALTLTNGGLGVVGDIHAGGSLTLAGDLAVDGSTFNVDATQNRVGILTASPGYPLDVHGAANVGALTTTSVSGDGSGITNILSSSVNDFSSNVTRIGTLETDLGSNVTRITNLESSDMTIGGEKTFSSSLTVGGDVTVTDTTSGSAAGPEFSLYRNQTGTNGDYLGQLRFDGKHDGGNDQLYAKITGKIKKADQGGEDGVIETAIITDGSQRISLRHTGDLFHIKKGTDFQVGETANLYVDTSTSRVGIGMSNPSYTLDVDGDINLSTGSTLKINGTDAVFSNWTANGSDIYRSSGNVGIGTTSPQTKLNVRGSVSTGRNIAREVGTVISYSSQIQSSRGAANIINGDKNFEIHNSDWITANGQRDNAYVVIDLGAAYSVDRLVIYNQNEYSDSRREVKGFKLQGSADNSTWTDVITSECGRSNAHEANPGWSFRIPQNWDDDTEGSSYRYWKFIMTSFHGTDGYGGIMELELYEASDALDDEVSTSSLVAEDVYGETGNFSRGVTIGKGYGGTSTGANNLLVEGNVGIGTTSPVSKLNVSLDSETGSSNTVGLTIQNYSSDYTQIAGGFGSRIQFKTNRGTSSTSTSASADIKGYIYSGAGGTGDYHALDLDVYGDNSSLNRGISILSQSSSGGPANTIMYGNVGIGTPSPGTKLHVQSVGTGTTVLITGPTQGNSGGPNNDPWTGLEFQRLGTNGETYNGSVNLRAYRWATSGQDPAMALRFNLSSTAPYNTADVMTLRSDGNVGIGVTSPATALHVQTGTGGSVTTFKIGDAGYLYLARNHVSAPYISTTMSSGRPGIRFGNSDNWLIRKYNSNLDFDYNSSTKGYLLTTSSGELNFTGQHRTFIKDTPFTRAEELEGLVVSADNNKYIKMSGGIEAGSNAITMNESLPVVSLSTKVNDKKCFGVISASEDPETREDAFGNFVSVSQKETGDTRVYINSVGEGAMWVVNTADTLESGDYITTSNVAGYGQRQDSEFLANYTVAKITMDCDFNPVTQPIQIIKKELSNVNYWVKTTVSNVSLEEYSNLAEDVRTTTTEIYYSNEDGEITTDKYNTLESNVQSTYTELTRTIHQEISIKESKTEQEGSTLEVRQELMNVLDEHGQLQWEDDPSGATERAYKIRYLDANGNITDEANAVHIAAFVGCTYHCG